jgi:hypothetical protein
MADSKYPNELDTDVELPRVDDNIVEIGGDAINGLRSAVFNIEQTLGVNPQGTAADMAARLNQSLNPDGTIKASALSTIGLVTLPITNSMVANNAGILESKLDLNYSTKNLRELIGALRVEHDALVLTVQGDITNLSRHVAHPSTFGRHRTSDIDGYIGKYVDYNLQGIVDDLDTRIMDHLSDPIDAHDASAISFDDTDTFINADEVQTAIEKLDDLGVTTLTMHQDNQHSNGILTAQKTYEPNTFHGNVVVSSAALNAISSGATNVSYTSTPSTLSQVIRGDRIDITIDSNVYTRYIESVDSTFGVVNFFMALPVGGISPTAVIYRTTEEAFAPSTLQLAVRHDSISGNLGGSVLQLIHPSAPHILSNGLDVRAITASAKNIKIAWETGVTGDIDAYQALQTYPAANSTPSVWTPENLAIALNEEFKKDGNNYPLVAFVYRGEVGIAFDEPDGYVEFRAPSSNSAWAAFGLSGTEIDYVVTPRRFYLDGYDFSEIRKVVDATAITDNSTVIKNISVDLTALGIGQTGIVRVKNHVDAGTYVFNASTSNSLTISSHIGNFASDTNVNIEIYSDSFAVPIDTGVRTLFELFMDGYNHEHGELRGAPRVEYIAGGGSTASPQEWFDIIDVSRDFTVGTKRINFQDVAGDKIVKLGTPVTAPPASTDVTNPGESYVLPTTDVIGHRFRLYDYNNVDYIDIEIVDNGFALVAADQAIDLTIHKRISEEKYVQIGQVLHDTDRFKHLSDRRLTGTVGRKDVRSDYSRDYVSYPRSLLRGNGVIYGCEVSGSTVINGGQVLVDGSIFTIPRTEFDIPTDSDTATYNIFVDSEGAIRFLKDNQDAASLSTPSIIEIINSSDKTILAQVDINGSSSTVTDIRDLRRFVNKLDNKVELLVEENDINCGSFASLRAAANYLNAQGSSTSSSTTIKVRGEIFHNLSDGPLFLPDDVTLAGESNPFISASRGSKITLYGSGSSFIIPGQGVRMKGLYVQMEAGSSCETIVGASGFNIVSMIVEDCRFVDIESSSTMCWFKADGINGLFINRCTASLDASNGDAKGIYTDSLTSLSIEKTSVVFSDNSNNNSMIEVHGPGQRMAIRDSRFAYPAPANSSYFYVSPTTSTLTDIRVENVTVTSPSVGGQYFISGISTLERCIVSESYIELFESFVSSNIMSDCMFNKNMVMGPVQFAAAGSMDEVTITDNTCEASGNVTGAYIFVESSVHVNICHNTFELLGTINSGIQLGAAQGVYVAHNDFTIGSATNYIVGFPGGGYDIFVDHNSFVFLGTVTYVIRAQMAPTGDLYTTHITNNNVVTEDDFTAFVECEDACDGVIVGGNIISAPLATIGRFFQVGDNSQNIQIINNICVFDGTASNGSVIHSDYNIIGLYVCDNVFVSNSTLGSGSFVDLDTVVTGWISGNLFNLLSGTAGAIMKIVTDSQELTVTNNMFKSTSTSGATGYMFHMVNTSNHTIISNNGFLNPIAVSQGFSGAILFADGGGAESTDHGRISITGNIIREFSGSSAKAIHVQNGFSIIVANNYVDGNIFAAGGSRDPVVIEDCIYISITGNYLFSSEVECIRISGPSGYTTYNESIINISNNIILQFSLILNQLINISSTTPRVGVISNNTIIHFNALTIIAMSIINVDAHNFQITNNMIHTNWFDSLGILVTAGTFSGLKINYTTPVIVATGDNTVVAFNHMRRVDGTDLVTASGANSVDYMNWGQTYTTLIPASRAVWDDSSGWMHFFVATPYKAQLRNTGVGNAQAGIEFTSVDIPAGATITKVEMYVSTLDTSDLTAYLRRSSFDETGTSGETLSGPVNPPSTGYTTLSMTVSTNNIVNNNETYCVYFTTDASTLSVWVESVRVYYTL